MQLKKLIMRTSPVAHIFTAPKLISVRSITTFVILDIRIVLYGYTDPLMIYRHITFIIPSQVIIIATEPETT
jgi:hypothetical protein